MKGTAQPPPCLFEASFVSKNAFVPSSGVEDVIVVVIPVVVPPVPSVGLVPLES